MSVLYVAQGLKWTAAPPPKFELITLFQLCLGTVSVEVGQHNVYFFSCL